jgi:hypothetical protein
MKETLLFAFSNNEREHLPALEEEFRVLNTTLSRRSKVGDFFIQWAHHTDKSQLTGFIGQHQQDLVLFHFSGHAGSDKIILDDQEARSEGLAHLLKLCPKLRVVVLNGCSTRGQVEALLEHVPAVIFTSAPVKDHIAKTFSIQLYLELERGKSLGDAFELALGAVKLDKAVTVARGIKLPQTAPDEPLWGISCKNKAALEFTLPGKKLADNLFDKKIPTEFDCYCCNRDEHFEEVAQFLNKREDAPLLHFFLPSYHHDAPESFVSRVFYELLPEDNRCTVDKRSQAGGGEHLDFLKLPGDELRTSAALKDIQYQTKVFSDPKYPEHVLLFFILRLKNWTAASAREFIRHISDGNAFPDLGAKKMRLFYWLDLTGHQPHASLLAKLFGGESTLEALRKPCSAHSHICFLDPLPEVERADAAIWFSKHCSSSTHYEHCLTDLFQGASKRKMAVVESRFLSLVQPYHEYRLNN